MELEPGKVEFILPDMNLGHRSSLRSCAGDLRAQQVRATSPSDHIPLGDVVQLLVSDWPFSRRLRYRLRDSGSWDLLSQQERLSCARDQTAWPVS